MKAAVLCFAALMGAACAQTEPAPSPPLISGAIHFSQPEQPQSGRSQSQQPQSQQQQPQQQKPEQPSTIESSARAEAEPRGFCIVRFDVESSGSTRNHRLVECEPRGIFEARSLQAARSIRYAPASAPRRDLQHRFDF